MKKSLVIHPHELSKKWIDRMVSLGVDTLGIHPEGGSDTHEHLMKLIDTMQTEEFRSLVDYACDKGLCIEYEIHAASYFMPREHFDTHPEYFRMDKNGERVRKFNFCSTNPQALEIIVDRAVELAGKLYRSTPNFYFWMDDVKDSWCHCDRCSQLPKSDQQLYVLNKIIKPLREKIPGAKLAYLAYYGTITPPTEIKPEEGIFLEYAPIERDFSKSVSEMGAEELDKLKRLVDCFGKKNAKVLEYWLDNSLFSRRAKKLIKLEPDNDLMKKDIEFYNRMGFDYISTFACFLGEDYEKLYGEADISGFSL